jgi:hypothetical protein
MFRDGNNVYIMKTRTPFSLFISFLLIAAALFTIKPSHEVRVNLWPPDVREFSTEGGDEKASPWWPVSMTPLRDHQYLMANYTQIILLDSVAGTAKIMQPEESFFTRARKGVAYNPTGLFFSTALNLLFVANYTVNNLLIFQVDVNSGILHYVREIRTDHTISPENIWVSEKGDFCVCANYNGDSVTAFDISADPARELWNTPIKSAHGVCMSGNRVYATGLKERSLFELDKNTGAIIRQVGHAGWNPEKMEFLWPTSVQPFSPQELIISDAHTGFISIVDSLKLVVTKYFGGNGPSWRFLNMPYTAVTNGDELAVASTFQNRLLFGNSKRFSFDRTYACNARDWAYTEKDTQLSGGRLGIGWKEYIWEKGPALSIIGEQYLLGYAHLHPQDGKKHLPALVTPYKTESLFNKTGELYFLNKVDLPGGFLLFTEQRAQAYCFYQGDVQYFFPLLTAQDSWCDGNELYTPPGKIDLKSLADDISRKAEELKKKRLSTGLLKADDVRQVMFPHLSEAVFARKLKELFTTTEGKKFYEEYKEAQHDGWNREKVEVMGDDYFLSARREEIIPLDELMTVHMLTGRELSPHACVLLDTEFPSKGCYHGYRKREKKVGTMFKELFGKMVKKEKETRMPLEHRTLARISKILTINSHVPGEVESFLVMTDELDTHGMKCSTSRMLREGEELSLDILLSSSLPKLMVKGQVRWCRETTGRNRASSACGIEFTGISTEDRNFLTRHIQRYAIEVPRSA